MSRQNVENVIAVSFSNLLHLEVYQVADFYCALWNN